MEKVQKTKIRRASRQTRQKKKKKSEEILEINLLYSKNNEKYKNNY
jgi:hypothetical protein